MPILNPELVTEHLVQSLQDRMSLAGVNRLTVAVSGGIDSAVALALAVRAAGSENVTAAYLGIESSQESKNRAESAAKVQGVSLAAPDFTAEFLQIEKTIRTWCSSNLSGGEALVQQSRQNPTVKGSLKSTLRAPLIRYFNRMMGGGLVVGTGNEDEDRFLRFYQKGGDGEVDLNAFANLSKGEVRQLALYLNVPSEIVMAKPTPDLWGVGEAHSDEEELTQLSGGVPWTYTTVGLDGEYESLGTIEAMARWLDSNPCYRKEEGRAVPVSFFELHHWSPEGGKKLHESLKIYEVTLRRYGLTVDHAISALKWEQITRHKFNPNLHCGPSRAVLLQNEAITNKVF